MFNVSELLVPLIEYYGDNRVEVIHNENGYKVLIWFPEAEVSNELGLTHRIYDVFIRLMFTDEGKLVSKFHLLRTTFTSEEIIHNYIHSHVPRLRIDNLDWSVPCLGTSQANYTVASLMDSFDSTTFSILLSQIDDFVHTESLSGGPYIRMAELNTNNTLETNCTYFQESLCNLSFRKLIVDFISKYKYQVVYNGDLYKLAVSDTQLMLDLGDFLVDQIIEMENNNEDNSLLYKIFLYKGWLYRNKVIYTSGQLYPVYHSAENNPLPKKFIRFKGEKKYLRVIENEEQAPVRYVAAPEYTVAARTLIERYLNYA